MGAWAAAVFLITAGRHESDGDTRGRGEGGGRIGFPSPLPCQGAGQGWEGVRGDEKMEICCNNAMLINDIILSEDW